MSIVRGPWHRDRTLRWNPRAPRTVRGGSGWRARRPERARARRTPRSSPGRWSCPLPRCARARQTKKRDTACFQARYRPREPAQRLALRAQAFRPPSRRCRRASTRAGRGFSGDVFRQARVPNRLASEHGLRIARAMSVEAEGRAVLPGARAARQRGLEAAQPIFAFDIFGRAAFAEVRRQSGTTQIGGGTPAEPIARGPRNIAAGLAGAEQCAVQAGRLGTGADARAVRRGRRCRAIVDWERSARMPYPLQWVAPPSQTRSGFSGLTGVAAATRHGRSIPVGAVETQTGAGCAVRGLDGWTLGAR